MIDFPDAQGSFYILFVDEFPMTITGKVQKFKMREQSVIELGLKRSA